MNINSETKVDNLTVGDLKKIIEKVVAETLEDYKKGRNYSHKEVFNSD